MKSLKFILPIALLGSMMVLPGVSFGASLTAFERLSDPQPFDLFSRDLSRTRGDSTGITVENNDGIIISENNVSDSFGITNRTDVSYSHRVDWINPPSSNFTGYRLEIKAWGNLGSNEIVFAENFNLGPLNNGGFFTAFFSNTAFSGTNSPMLNAVLADGFLDISIDKNLNAGFLGRLNKVSIYDSKLTVQYEPVPEPSTMLLFGTGIAGLSFWRLKKKGQQN